MQQLDSNIVKYAEVEVLAALDKDPTDIELVANAITQWERAGESALLASASLYTLSKVSRLESKVDTVLTEIKELKEILQGNYKITTQKLASKLVTNPDLKEGFEVYVNDNNEPKLAYRGKTDKQTMYRAYDDLHAKLVRYYGFKEITYKVTADALLKSFNWLKLELEDEQSAQFVSLVLTKADFHYLRKRAKKITLSELKNCPELNRVDNKILKSILLEAGWVTVKQGSSRTLFFTKES